MRCLSKIHFTIYFFILICISVSGSDNPKSDTCYKTADANYLINRYVISSGGCINASNTNFLLCSTIGETSTGRMTGTNNIMQVGFWSEGLFLTDVEDKSNTGIPKTFELMQNFPNPFNPSTYIEFQIANQGFVSLKVYDLLGREVNILVNEEKPAGYYKVTWNAANLPSGIYFYQLKAADYVKTKKMILLK